MAIKLLVLLIVGITASLDCIDNNVGYTLPCNKDLDPWKETRKKFDDMASDLVEESDDPDIWTRSTDGKETVETVLGSHDAIIEAADAVSELFSGDEVEDAADAAADAAEEIAEKAKGATKWLQKGAKALKALATAAQFVGPILDIVLLFAPASKSDELVAIESGFAKMGAKIDSLAHKLENVNDAADWNTVVGKLLEFEGNVNHITKSYKQVVQEIKNADLSRGLPGNVKGQIEHLVDAVKEGEIGTQLQLVDNLMKGNSGFTKGKTLLEIFAEAVDNDCSQILPMSSRIISMIKGGQRLQYFYEINQQLVMPHDDKGYPRIVYDMYKNAMTSYEKCTKNAVLYAQKEMQVKYGNDEALTDIIDGMEPKYELYNWATLKEDDKEETGFALIDHSASKLNIELTGISEDEKEKQRLTMFAVRKASRTQVADAIERVKKVLVSLEKEDLPKVDGRSDKEWDDASQEYRDKKLGEVRELLKRDKTIKSMINDQRLSMAMFKNDTTKISLSGWHFKTNMELLSVTYSNYNRKVGEVRLGFTLGFLFNFEEDTSSFNCTNGNGRALSIDGSFVYCLCDIGYGGDACDVVLNDAPQSTLSTAVLNVVQDYKVPGMFDLQEDIKKGTEAIMNEMENSKLEIFSELKNTGRSVEKSKNAILSAQSVMLDQMKADNRKILQGLTGLQTAMDAAFERERNDRIYRTKQGQKVVLKAISDSSKAITEKIQQLTGKVIENRYFKELKISIPVYQEKFQEAISYGGFAELIFNKYLDSNEHNFHSAKESAKKAMVEENDSFVLAQMQMNMISGCTGEYTEKIKSTWAEMMELHLTMTTMEFWNLDYKIKTSSSKLEEDYWNHRKSLLDDKTKSETDLFKRVIKTRSCPEFTFPELLGGGCEASITYPGQVVPMQCEDPRRTLLLLSSNEVFTEVSCNKDSTWALDMSDLECVFKCRDGDEFYDIGEKKRLPDPPTGFYFADEDGLKITESTCAFRHTEFAGKDIAEKSSWDNLALNQIAEQKDNYNSASTASNAVDGNRNGIFGDGSVSHTGSINAWWKVTLPVATYISYIDVYNRMDCCQSRLRNAHILIDGDLVGTVPQEDGIQSYTIPIFRRGQEVKIEAVSGETLQLAEVEVFGPHAAWSNPHYIAEKSSWVNLALNQIAEQTDNYDSGSTASNAVDGNRNGRWGDGSVSHTGSINAWWKVTLPVASYISYIDVYNRMDCCQSRLRNAHILIDGDLVGTVPQEDGIQSYTIPILRRGQEVKIEAVSGETLQLAEVEVFGPHAAWSNPHKVDINECDQEDFCNPGGTCRNTFGSFLCTCAAGYSVGDDGKCHDINECALGSEGHQKCLVQKNLGTCLNEGGGHKCGCLSGSYTTAAQRGKECLACNCNSNGVTSEVCDGATGQCLCNPNVGGADCGKCKEGFTNFPYCSQCAPGYYGYPECNKCSCTDSGITDQYCDSRTGVCLCKENVAGRTCDECKLHFKSFPSCVPDVQDGQIGAWGAWTGWVDDGHCGPSYVKGYTRTRTRSRSCDDSTKNIHGRSCSGDKLKDTETRFNDVCKSLTGVFITLHTSYYAGTSADLWMGVRQGTTECRTSRPTWDGPDEEDWQKTYWKDANGCSNTFDETKSVDIYLYSDSSNDVRVTKMGVKVGETVKTWYTGGSYTSIDEDEGNGWYNAK